MNSIFAAGCLALVVIAVIKRRPVIAATIVGAGAIWLFYAPGVHEWITNLGTDSLSEAQDFDTTEALDYLRSLRQVVRRQSEWTVFGIACKGFLFGLVMLGPIALLSRRRSRRSVDPVLLTAMAMVVGTVALQLYPAVAAFRSNSNFYHEIRTNFQIRPIVWAKNEASINELNVVLFIGESTSALNMSVYGYPRPTTPHLMRMRQSSDRFVLFNNVLSTHVHTMPSLLEALSLSIDGDENFLPIDYRRRLSLIDALNQAGVRSTLISNQGSAGTWNNLASTVIFGNVGERYFSFNSALLGDLDHRAKRPLDHEYLVPMLDEHGNLDRAGPHLVILHSYAGHGPYLRFISQDFRQPLDDLLTRYPERLVIGSSPQKDVKWIEDYDSAIRYIDYNVGEVMKLVEETPLPAIMVYFADHGDAVYAGRLHDSSRFVHEMARVPFLVYFNRAAAGEYPDLLRQTRAASASNRISTLAQLPATLLSLFGLQIENGLYYGIGLDEASSLYPILTRETSAGFSFIPLVAETSRTKQQPSIADSTDPYTAVFRVSRGTSQIPASVCAPSAGTVGETIRAAMVADCVSMEVDDGNVFSSREWPRISLEDAWVIAAGYGPGFWIAVDGRMTGDNCQSLDRILAEADGDSISDVLVTFSVDVTWSDSEFLTCIGSLRGRGLRVGLKLDSQAIVRCAAASAQSAKRDWLQCKALEDQVQAIENSGMFTDLAVDALVVDDLEKTGIRSELAWNAWNVGVESLNSSRFTRFRMIQVQLLIGENHVEK